MANLALKPSSLRCQIKDRRVLFTIGSIMIILLFIFTSMGFMLYSFASKIKHLEKRINLTEQHEEFQESVLKNFLHNNQILHQQLQVQKEEATILSYEVRKLRERVQVLEVQLQTLNNKTQDSDIIDSILKAIVSIQEEIVNLKNEQNHQKKSQQNVNSGLNSAISDLTNSVDEMKNSLGEKQTFKGTNNQIKDLQQELKSVKDRIEATVKIDNLGALESFYDEKISQLSRELKEMSQLLNQVKSSQADQEKMGEIIRAKLEGLQEFTFKSVKELQKIDKTRDFKEEMRETEEPRFGAEKVINLLDTASAIYSNFIGEKVNLDKPKDIFRNVFQVIKQVLPVATESEEEL